MNPVQNVVCAKAGEEISNGVKLSASKISVIERGYLYGDGIFDTMRSYNGKIFRFEDHMERLNKNARALGMNCVSCPRILRILEEAFRKNKLKNAYIRVTLSRGKAGLGPKPVKGVEPLLTVIVRPSKIYPLHFYKKGVEILIGSTRRLSPCTLDGKIKSINYLNSILAREEATRRGAFETILLSEEGYVTEGASSNIFIVKGGGKPRTRKVRGKLLTPPSYLGVLEGIARKVVLEIAERLGIETEMVPFTAHNIYTARECFLTSTGIEVMPVRMVDGRVVGKGRPGEITEIIGKEFKRERNKR